MRRPSPLAALLAVGLAVGAAGACGGGGDDDGAAGSSPPGGADPTTTTAPTTSTGPTTTTTAPGLELPALAPVVAGELPRAADTAAGIAEQLAQAEAVIRDPEATPELVDAAGRRVAQVAYRRLGGHPEWDAEVLAALDPALHPAVTTLVGARRELRAMHPTLSDTLPAWRIVEPLPADQLVGMYQEAEATYGVPWPVLAAVHLTETAMGRIQGLSVAGAQGPMQFMPGTWEAYGMGGDVEDPHDAIMGAANYLRANGGAEGTVERLEHALYRYNNSDRYVSAVRAIADVITAEPITYRGFHAWDVVYLSTAGEVLLATGYESSTPIPAAQYLTDHPEAAIR